MMSLQIKSKLSQEAEKDGGGRLKAIIDTVIGNLQTSITNVHIRYEVSAEPDAVHSQSLVAKLGDR